MFRSRYVMAAGLFLLWLVGQLDLVHPEPLCPTRAVVGRDSVGRVAGEVAVDRPLATAPRVRGDDEADPADDVVDGVGSRAPEQAVDREHELFPDHLVEGARELRVVEVR